VQKHTPLAASTRRACHPACTVQGVPGLSRQAGLEPTQMRMGAPPPVSPNRTGSVSPALWGSTGGLGRNLEVGEKDLGGSPFTTAWVSSAIGNNPSLHMHSLKNVLLIGSCVMTCFFEYTLPRRMPRGIQLISTTPCALVEVLEQTHNDIDLLTGIWIVRPCLHHNECQCLTLVHASNIFQACHLVGCSGDIRLPPAFHFSHSHVAFCSFYLKH
jgi:hypothetical protein